MTTRIKPAAHRVLIIAADEQEWLRHHGVHPDATALPVRLVHRLDLALARRDHYIVREMTVGEFTRRCPGRVRRVLARYGDTTGPVTATRVAEALAAAADYDA